MNKFNINSSHITPFNILSFGAILFLMMIFPACVFDNAGLGQSCSPPSPGEENPAIVLKLNAFRSGKKEKLRSFIRGEVQTGIEDGKDGSNGSLDENAIQNVSIFFFSEDGNTLFWQPTDLHLSTQNTDVVIPVPQAKWSHFNGLTKYLIYVVVNSSTTSLSNFNGSLSELKKKVLSLSNNAEASVVEFTMTGASASAQAIKLDDTSHIVWEAGLIDLTRVAVKVRAIYPTFPSDGKIKVKNHSDGTIASTYQIDLENIKVRLLSYATQSYLDEPRNYYAKATSSILQKKSNDKDFPLPVTSGIQRKAVFYCFENAWDENDDDGPLTTALEYVVPMKKTGETSYTNYYYRYPIVGTSTNNTNAQNPHNKVKRNHIYEITPVISRLGRTFEDPFADMEAYYAIKDWTQQTLEYEIKPISYLVVKEHDVIIPNVDEYEIDFLASNNVSAQVVEAYFTRYIGDDQSEDVQISESDDSYPKVQVNNQTKKIIINSEIPSNFTPRHFTIKVVDSTNGFEDLIKVTQYPDRWITGSISRAEDKVPGVQYLSNPSAKNFNLYEITTLTGSDIFLGDPTEVDENGIIRTKTDPESNLLISPKFVIASQFGVYPRVSYNGEPEYDERSKQYVVSAVQRCATYSEGGYPVGTWRLPTQAEIKYVDMLQDLGKKDPNKSAVKTLLAGDRYWSAVDNYTYFTSTDVTKENIYDKYDGTNILVGYGVQKKAFPRCVHDIYSGSKY